MSRKHIDRKNHMPRTYGLRVKAEAEERPPTHGEKRAKERESRHVKNENHRHRDLIEARHRKHVDELARMKRAEERDNPGREI